MKNKLYLYHHGIKGQRWGVRRFQNGDGTLTNLGKKRYGDPKEHGNSISNREGKRLLESDYKRADAKAAKAILDGTASSLNTAANAVDNIGKHKSKTVNDSDYTKITDEELRKRINRLNMERNYGELTGDTKRVRTGADWTRELLQTAGAIVAIGGSAATIAIALHELRLDKPKKGGA